MDADTLTRVRRVVEDLRGAMEFIPRDVYAGDDLVVCDALTVNEDGDEPPRIIADCSRAPVVSAGDLVTVLRATTDLIALAEAVGRLAEGDEWWYFREPGWEESIPSCIGCGALNWAPGSLSMGHAPDCPALAIDAALAELAALDGGEVAE